MIESASESDEINKGVQPLDKVMMDLGLTDANLVDKSRKKIVFRMVAKARKGRRIKLRHQMKILEVLNDLVMDKKFTFTDLFNYTGPRG